MLAPEWFVQLAGVWIGIFDTDKFILKDIFNKNSEKIPEGYYNWGRKWSVLHNYEKLNRFFRLILFSIAFKNISLNLSELNFLQ